jgi:peptidoglycan/LPS O-acetylase OafA/YrhL
MCIGAALVVSAASLALVVAEGANPTTANIDTDWVMTAHYVAIFIVGATLAVHRTAWQRWLMQGKRAFAILAASLALYFLSRSAILVLPVAVGQFAFDWGVAAGAAGIICAAMVSRRLTAALAVSPVKFLGKISYSLYLTHTVVLLAILHLLPFPDQVWPALATAAVLAIPVAAASYFLVERPSMMLGQFLTGKTTAAAQANRTP